MSHVQFAPAVSDDMRLAQKVAGERYFAEPTVLVNVIWVNCYQAADSALPFGGTKESGWGRETCRETLEEYLETKTVVVSL